MKIFKTWITAAVLFGGLLLTACTNDDNPSGSSVGSVEEQLRKMTLREKVGQMFYVRPEARINQSVRRILTLKQQIRNRTK